MGLFSNFGVDLPGILKDALADALLPGILTRTINAIPSPATLTGPPNASYTSHTFRGFVDEWPGSFPMNYSFEPRTTVQRGDVVVTILQKTIRPFVRPKAGDAVKIEGDTYTIVSVGRDPANAMYKLQARGP